MNAIRIWESIYTRYLEIEHYSTSGPESLQLLLEQFATIAEMIPDDVDPAVDFELYVLDRLSLSAGKTLERFLVNQENANVSSIQSG